MLNLSLVDPGYGLQDTGIGCPALRVTPHAHIGREKNCRGDRGNCIRAGDGSALIANNRKSSIFSRWSKLREVEEFERVVCYG
jgi:hypothetical protein